MPRLAKQRRAELTRRDLLDAARQVFAARGFADASMEEIAERAGVSRGPLYHYFDDKQDLFRAIFIEIERELAEAVLAGVRERAAPGAGAWEQVHAGNHAFLDACLDPAVQRIALLEAPAVLGWDARRDFARYGLGLIRNGLQQAIDEGVIEPQPIEPLAHLLRAVLSEGALLIARAEDHAAARAEVGAAIDRLMEGLRQSTVRRLSKKRPRTVSS
ncbi:MAG TPA: helix-turn-helix domain-containing protein [Dehalococcoidia bacterium]|nr:helix-turn-helix domain-containing protein [Dehalococcoidia bacterium]